MTDLANGMDHERKYAVEQHFVVFCSPGTLFAEQTTKPIDSWNVDKAVKMAHEIVERYNSRPYGFQFTTRARADDELDSHEIKRSGTYYLGGQILTIEDVEARGDPDDRILLSNMRGNGYDRIIVNTNSWKWTQPFRDEDVLLDVVFAPPKPESVL